MLRFKTAEDPVSALNSCGIDFFNEYMNQMRHYYAGLFNFIELSPLLQHIHFQKPSIKTLPPKALEKNHVKHGLIYPGDAKH